MIRLPLFISSFYIVSYNRRFSSADLSVYWVQLYGPREIVWRVFRERVHFKLSSGFWKKTAASQRWDWSSPHTCHFCHAGILSWHVSFPSKQHVWPSWSCSQMSPRPPHRVMPTLCQVTPPDIEAFECHSFVAAHCDDCGQLLSLLKKCTRKNGYQSANSFWWWICVNRYQNIYVVFWATFKNLCWSSHSAMVITVVIRR